jgi:hypothetical protein
MTDEITKNEEIILAFHKMWDSFPGIARLIDKRHLILASNKAAEEKGFIEGIVCARVGSPETHKGCMANLTLKTQIPRIDKRMGDKIRGWMPVKGREDLLVHFTLPIPEE